MFTWFDSAFWGHDHRSQREMLSTMVGGFDKDVLEKFYALTPDQFARLLNLYSAEYGEGAAEYAREVSSVVIVPSHYWLVEFVFRPPQTVQTSQRT